jgi:hypothetical protein
MKGGKAKERCGDAAPGSGRSTPETGDLEEDQGGDREKTKPHYHEWEAFG